MLATAYVISFLGMIVLPVLFGIYLLRKFRLSWKLLLAGGLTFIVSQVLHIPLLSGLTALFKNGTLSSPPAAWATLFNAVLLGLLAGVFEETARYILFKFALKQARTWDEGLLVGVGHGGTEAVIIGILAGLAFVNMVVYRNIDLSTVPSIPADQLALAKQQVAAYWSAPVYMAFMGLIERVFAMCLHLALSVMVLYSIVSKKPVWFWLALLWHAVVDGTAVYLAPKIGILAVEGIVAVMAILSLWILFSLRQKFPPQPIASIAEDETGVAIA